MRRSIPSLLIRGAGRTALLVGLVGAAAVMGCVTAPYTGYMLDNTPAGQKLDFDGRADNAAPAVSGYVLSNAANDPLVGPWTKFNGNVTVTGPHQDPADTTPWWDWSFRSAALTSTQWPDGGLARFKVTGKANGSASPVTLTTFDNEAAACAFAPNEINLDWKQRGQDCMSPYYNAAIITAVSTNKVPDDGPTTMTYLVRGGDHDSQTDDAVAVASQTQAYYDTIGAPLTLTDFRSFYGFASGDTQALYYNQGDLGIARDMHCKKKLAIGQQPITACYVTNFGRVRDADHVALGRPTFGTMPAQDAMDQAISFIEGDSGDTDSTPVATVAMVYDPNLPANNNRVKFMVFDASGDLDRYAALDDPGVDAYEAINVRQIDVVTGETSELPTVYHTAANVNVPDNCLACHGLNATYTRSTTVGVPKVANAAFLPFDPQSFVYSNNSTYSESITKAKLKSLNALVWGTTTATTQIGLLLKGMYPVGATPTGPQDPNSVFNPDYIPSGWTGSKLQKEVYTEVVKPYCRTCHVTASSSKDWDTFTELQSWSGMAASLACGGGGDTMPHSQQTLNNFWRSPARAHLVSAFQISGACAP